MLVLRQSGASHTTRSAPPTGGEGGSRAGRSSSNNNKNSWTTQLAVVCSTILLLLSASGNYQAAAAASSTVDIKSKLIKSNDINHANKIAQTAAVAVGKPENQLTPVILLPGDGGSRLQAKLNRRDVLHHYCERKSSDWFDLYLSLSNLVPFALDCWLDK